MTNNNYDTLDFLTDEDIQLMDDINKIKKHILTFFNPEVLVDKIRGFIKDSDILDFNNARSEKFINVRRPVYVIKLDKEKALEKYPLKRGRFLNESDEIEWITSCVYEEVIRPFSKFLADALRDDEDLDESLSNIFTEIPQDVIDLGMFLMSSIFGIKIDKQQYLVHLEYMY